MTARKARGLRPRVRCAWARSDLAIRYHDEEWGVPVHDDRYSLRISDPGRRASRAELGHDPQQARELSGSLRQLRCRRESPATTGARCDSLLRRSRHRAQPAQDRIGRAECAGIPARAGRIRQLRRLHLAVRGRQAARELVEIACSQVPPRTAESDAMSKDLKRRGFNFVGSTICYAFMQAVGMVNDHSVDASGTRRWRHVQKRSVCVPQVRLSLIGREDFASLGLMRY